MIHNDLGDHCAIVKDVLFCPHISTNLLSINQLTCLGVNVQFVGKECQILNADMSPIGIAHLSNGLYRLPCTVNGIEKVYITKYISSDVKTALVSCVTVASASIDVWHA